MEPARLSQMIAEISALLSERLHARGKTLPARLASAGRLLPRRLRADARRLIDAEPLAAHPRLARQVDPKGIEAAHRRLVKWLKGIDVAEARKTALLRLLAVISVNVFIVIGAALTIAHLRGLL